MYFIPINGVGGGARVLVPLAMPVTVVHPRFVNRGPKRGSEAAERGEGVGSRYRDFFIYLCMKTAFSCILNAIIGCVGVKWNRAIFQSMGGGGGTWDLPTEGQSEGVGGGCGRGKLPSQGIFLCLRTKGVGGIMFSGCPFVRIFFCLRNNSSVTWWNFTNLGQKVYLGAQNAVQCKQN